MLTTDQIKFIQTTVIQVIVFIWRCSLGYPRTSTTQKHAGFRILVLCRGAPSKKHLVKSGGTYYTSSWSWSYFEKKWKETQLAGCISIHLFCSLDIWENQFPSISDSFGSTRSTGALDTQLSNSTWANGVCKVICSLGLLSASWTVQVDDMFPYFLQRIFPIANTIPSIRLQKN